MAVASLTSGVSCSKNGRRLVDPPGVEVPDSAGTTPGNRSNVRQGRPCNSMHAFAMLAKQSSGASLASCLRWSAAWQPAHQCVPCPEGWRGSWATGGRWPWAALPPRRWPAGPRVCPPRPCPEWLRSALGSWAAATQRAPVRCQAGRSERPARRCRGLAGTYRWLPHSCPPPQSDRQSSSQSSRSPGWGRPLQKPHQWAGPAGWLRRRQVCARVCARLPGWTSRAQMHRDGRRTGGARGSTRPDCAAS